MQTNYMRRFVLLLIVVQMASLFLVAPAASAKSRRASFWSDFLRRFRRKKEIRAGGTR